MGPISELREHIGFARGPVGIIFDDIGNLAAEVELGCQYEAQRFYFSFWEILKLPEELFRPSGRDNWFIDAPKGGR